MKQIRMGTHGSTRNQKYLLTVLLMLSLLIPGVDIVNVADAKNQTTLQAKEQEIQSQTIAETDTYIITLEQNKQGDKILQELDDAATEEYQSYCELPEENIAVIQADETTIQELKKTDSVLRVEEDIILNGSKKFSSQKTHKEAERSLQKKKQKIAEWKEKVFTEDTGASWNIQMVGADNISDKKLSGEEKADRATHKPSICPVKVAVIDSGMDMTEHYDVKEHINFVKDDENVALFYEDRTGHGTAIAGVIAGNSSGIPGINPDVEIYSLKVLDENNQSPVSRIVEAVHWCIEHDIQIINMSFGTSLDSPALRDAVSQAAKAGILMIAAAGNTGGSVEYPAAYKQVMAVGCVDSQGEVSDYSCEGSSVEILAPGEKILTEGAFSGVVVASGTSMAVPHVTGAASLIWQKDAAVSATFVRELLKVSAKNVDGRNQGILDIEYALEQYNTFKENYVENSNATENGIVKKGAEETSSAQEYGVEENTSEVEIFDTDNLVDGSWGHTLHEDSVTKGMMEWGPVNNVDVSIIRKFAATADSELDLKDGKHTEGDYNYRKTNGLHGGGNYVASMQYIYNVAKRVENGKTVADAIKATKYKGSLTKEENGFTGTVVKKGLDGAMKAISKNGKTNREKSQRILALAVHVAGDMYAHQSMVPKSSLDKVVKSTDKVTGNYFSSAHFGVSTAKNWKDTKKYISDGTMKFVKIKNGIPDSKVPKGETKSRLYEDNINFYPSRYKRATVYTVGRMLYDLYAANDYFDSWCLVPELYHSNGYNIKRLKIYDFAVECCSDTLTSEEKALLKKYSASNSVYIGKK